MSLKEFFKPLLPKSLREATYPARERLGRVPLNLRADLRVLRHLRLGGGKVSDLAFFEKRVYSQNNEDGVLAAIFAAIGTTNRFLVEFGVEDGSVCNTRLLRRQGWRCLWMDPAEQAPRAAAAYGKIEREFVTAENINALLDKHGVPTEFDLLSIDIDGNDYWVWKAVAGRRPRVVSIEYNALLGCERPRTVRYRSDFRWDGTQYYGASLPALERLGREKGYVLVGCESHGVNAFFVLAELADRFEAAPLERLYRPLGAPHLPGPPPAAPDADWVEP